MAKKSDLRKAMDNMPQIKSVSFSRGFSTEEKSRFKELRELEEYLKGFPEVWNDELRHFTVTKINKAPLQARQEGRENAIKDLSLCKTCQYKNWAGSPNWKLKNQK